MNQAQSPNWLLHLIMIQLFSTLLGIIVDVLIITFRLLGLKIFNLQSQKRNKV